MLGSDADSGRGNRQVRLPQREDPCVDPGGDVVGRLRRGGARQDDDEKRDEHRDPGPGEHGAPQCLTIANPMLTSGSLSASDFLSSSFGGPSSIA